MKAPSRGAHPAVFARSIDALVLAAVDTGAVGFTNLLRHLPSVYPTDALASLDRLASRGAVSRSVATAIRRDAGRRASGQPEGWSLLPPPHPLDYE